MLLDFDGARAPTVVFTTVRAIIFQLQKSANFLLVFYIPMCMGIPQWWHRGIAIGLGDGNRPVCRQSLNLGKDEGSSTQWAFASSFALNCPHASAWNIVGGGQHGRLQQRPPTLPCHGGWLVPPQSHEPPDVPGALNDIASVCITTSAACNCRFEAHKKMRRRPPVTKQRCTAFDGRWCKVLIGTTPYPLKYRRDWIWKTGFIPIILYRKLVVWELPNGAFNYRR